MWVGKERSAWDRTAALISAVARLAVGASVEPAKLNPFRAGVMEPKPARTPEQLDRESEAAWGLVFESLGARR